MENLTPQELTLYLVIWFIIGVELALIIGVTTDSAIPKRLTEEKIENAEISPEFNEVVEKIPEKESLVNYLIQVLLNFPLNTKTSVAIIIFITYINIINQYLNH